MFPLPAAAPDPMAFIPSGSEALAAPPESEAHPVACKDLTHFGQFGTRGLGYDVAQLSKMTGPGGTGCNRWLIGVDTSAPPC